MAKFKWDKVRTDVKFTKTNQKVRDEKLRDQELQTYEERKSRLFDLFIGYWDALKIDLYSQQDRNEYTKLEYDKIEQATAKAVLIDGIWLPLSQIKLDTNNDVFVKNWLYQQKFN